MALAWTSMAPPALPRSLPPPPPRSEHSEGYGHDRRPGFVDGNPCPSAGPWLGPAALRSPVQASLQPALRVAASTSRPRCCPARGLRLDASPEPPHLGARAFVLLAPCPGHAAGTSPTTLGALHVLVPSGGPPCSHPPLLSHPAPVSASAGRPPWEMESAELGWGAGAGPQQRKWVPKPGWGTAGTRRGGPAVSGRGGALLSCLRFHFPENETEAGRWSRDRRLGIKAAASSDSTASSSAGRRGGRHGVSFLRPCLQRGSAQVLLRVWAQAAPRRPRPG